VINEADKKIAVTVPFGTDVTNLTPTIVHTGASITPASGTPQDFTNPVVYTVTAEDGTTAQYTVTVTIAANTDASLTALSVNPGSIAFDPETLTYDNVVVPYGTTEVTVTFTAAPQATTSVSSPQTVNIVGKTGTFSVEVTAGDGVAKNTYTINFIEALNPAKEITSFSFAAPAATGVINEADKKIAVTVPFGTDVTNLTPTIVHTGASITPASGTPQDFTNPVVYTVTAEDGTTAQYTVTVTIAANTDASLTALSVNPGSIAFDPETLTYDNVVVPYGTTEVTVTFTAAPQATTSVSSPQTVSIVGKTGTFSVEVTAGDGVAKNTYTINFIEALNPAKEITSFSFAAPAATGVINEADKKIAVTVPFGTDVTNLTPTIVHTGASITPASGTPQDFTNPVVYTVTAEDGTTAQYTVTVTIAANTDASLTALSVNPGSIAFDPETLTYDNVVVPYGTTEVTVTFTAAPQATTSVSSPQTVSIVGKTGTFSVEVTAGDGVAKNTYTINFIEALNPAKEITSFSFAAPAATGVINEADKKIAVTVPFGTDVTNLTPTIVHTGASITPASGTPQDFTNPVVYTVTAEDGTTAQYTVTVTIAANTDASLTALSVNPGSIVFDPETLTYDNVVVPYGTTEVTVTFMAAPQATTSVSSPQTVSIVGKTGTFSVEVTAGDGVAKNTYTINFIEALNPAKEITSFSFAAPAATGVINEADKKIAVTVPFGTDVTNLTPTIVHTGASISYLLQEHRKTLRILWFIL
jgi:flagellar hook assembly protein FlgD